MGFIDKAIIPPIPNIINYAISNNQNENCQVIFNLIAFYYHSVIQFSVQYAVNKDFFGPRWRHKVQRYKKI